MTRGRPRTREPRPEYALIAATLHRYITERGMTRAQFAALVNGVDEKGAPRGDGNLYSAFNALTRPGHILTERIKEKTGLDLSAIEPLPVEGGRDQRKIAATPARAALAEYKAATEQPATAKPAPAQPARLRFVVNADGTASLSLNLSDISLSEALGYFNALIAAGFSTEAP